MTAPELLALSLGLSLASAAVGLTLMRALERRVADPVLRERAWAAALYLPALPPLVVGLMLLTPAPTATASVEAAVATSTALVEVEAAAGWLPADPAHTAAVLVLILAGLFALLRLMSLGVRLMRLRDLLRATTVASGELSRTVEEAARTIGAAPPVVRIARPGAEALLAGLRRPVLVLPSALADTPDSAATRAVCAHELAHLKRGDHRALWVEELLLSLLAINPLLRLIRDHRAAAREEACDALALTRAGDDQRRLYAQALLEAVRPAGFARTPPALTFTSARRTFVMNRLKAVLAPASPADPASRRLAVGLAALIAGMVAAGSFAVAAQRQPVMAAATPEAAGANRPASASIASPRQIEVEAPVQAEQAAPVPAPAPASVIVPQLVRADVEPQPSPAPTGDQAQPAEISRVTWAQHPMPMYPATAAANGVAGGTVALACNVEADGRASGCTVLSETPEGQGFGEAALAAMERARFSSATMATATPGARARFTIRFRVAE